MTTYRYRLNVSQDLHPISSCLQNNRLLRGFLPPGEHNLVKREEGTARSCSDPLSFASFLAFALAVANLMMGNGRRRKRSSSENFCIDRDLKEDLIMSTSTIVTGVVFSFDQSRESCRERILCDTGRQLRHYGEVGQLMADATDLLSDEVHDTIKLGLRDECEEGECRETFQQNEDSTPDYVFSQIWELTLSVLQDVTG